MKKAGKNQPKCEGNKLFQGERCKNKAVRVVYIDGRPIRLCDDCYEVKK